MKKNIFNKSHYATLVGAMLLLSAPIALTGCKENISDEAYSIKTEQTITDYLTDTEDLSLIKSLFDEVKLGHATNASVLTSVLSARGNYTVFAPNNDAVLAYMKELTGLESPTISDLTDEQKEQIALNCIIDNGSSNAYEMADFPSDGSTFTTSNLKDRRLSCEQDENSDYIINGDSKVITSNVELSNGMLHIVDHVISPSTKSVAELIQHADNMHIMGKLLTVTSWADSLTVKTSEEEEYENDNVAYAGTTKLFTSHNFDYMEKRAVGYTAFVETDDVFNADWGIDAPVYDEASGEITNWSTILSQLESKCEALMVDASEPELYAAMQAAHGDYTNPNNAVNQFVAYHLLDGGMATDEFVQHYNEYDYDYGADMKNPQTTTYSVNVWEYFPTKGTPSGLLKITQLPDGDHDFYLNRISTYNDGIKGDYKETGFTPNTPENGLNIKVNALNGDNDNNALNGFYFPIDHVLVYSPAARQALGSERLRIDACIMAPELYSNDLRGKSAKYFPQGYFKNITNESQSTEVYYLRDGYVYSNGGWKDWAGDEFLITGRFDFVYKLPPVPESGTYELRMGVSLNTLRSMVQCYIGEDPQRTDPIGLPIDQRESTDLIPGTPWVDDGNLDEATIRENDRNLRNVNYMKAPNYMTVSGSKGKTTARNATPSTPALRRILTTQYFDRNKTYYMRFKCAIEASDKQFILDYFEFTPSKIVNGATPEDIW